MLPLLGIAAGLVGTGVWIWQRHERCVDLIEAELRKNHFYEFSIAIAWGRIGRRHYAYDVRYVDGRGRKHRNSCEVMVSSGEVRWRHRLERPSNQQRAVSGTTTPKATVLVPGKRAPERRR